MTRYGYLCNKNVITTQLENLKQNKDESLTDYSERARKLLRTKAAMYSHISKEQRDEYNRSASRAFMRGLNNFGLRQRVTTRGATSLENAIENAIDMELDTVNQVTNNELFCRSCRIVGHREKDCRRRNNNNDALTVLANAFRNMNNMNFNRRNDFLPRNNQQFRNMSRNMGNRPNFSNQFRNGNPGYGSNNNFGSSGYGSNGNFGNRGYGSNNNFNPGYNNNNSGYNNNFQPRFNDRARNFYRENDNFSRPNIQTREADQRDNPNRNPANNFRRNMNNNNRPNVVNSIRANISDEKSAENQGN